MAQCKKLVVAAPVLMGLLVIVPVRRQAVMILVLVVLVTLETKPQVIARNWIERRIFILEVLTLP